MLSPEHILQTGFGFRASHVLLAALEVGLFTELGKGPRSMRQLRRALGSNQTQLADLLEPLVALGLLDREGDDAGAVYLNSRESGHFLDRHSPGYLGEVLLRNAKAARSTQSKSFAGALLTIAAALLAERFDFSRYATLLDLGSPRGQLARAIAARHAHVRCTRLGIAVSEASNALPRADVIVMPMILRRFDKAARVQLMKRARRALSAGGCLIVIELLASDDRHRGSILAALSGTARHRHRALSGSDLDDGCRSAGFERTELLPLMGPLSATLAYRST